MKYRFQIFIIALIIWMFGSAYWYVCNIKGKCVETISNSDLEIKPVPTDSAQVINSILEISGNEFDLIIQDDILFELANSQPIISEEVTTGINEIFEHLNEYTTHGIEITGNYDDVENNNSILENLGIARAQSIKNILLEKGLSRDQISTKSIKKEKIVNGNGKVSGVISLRIHAMEELSEDDKKHLAHIEEVLRSESKMVYFEYGKDELALNDELRTYFSELNLFMHHHAHHSVTLIGHTDKIGNEKENEILGLERAEFVKNKLISAGIHADQIHTISKGENDPIKSDDSNDISM